MGVTGINAAMRTPRLATSLAWPWKTILPATVLVVFLGIGVPLFLASPIWIDVIFYDLCARTLLKGGMLYRDTFDTNLFGMVWTHVAVRSIVGWSPEAIRSVDLLVVAGIIWFLASWLRALDFSRGSRLWLALILFACYFAMSEWSHCQRDVWMLLPALAAMRLRRSHVCKVLSPPSASYRFSHACAEGILWALAMGIKPMAVVPALCCWLLSVHLIWSASRNRFWLIVVDLLGLILGASAVGGIAAFWLWQSGSTPYLWQIMRQWNPEYLVFSLSWAVRLVAWPLWVEANMPWPLVHIVAVPVSVWAIIRSVIRRRDLDKSLMADTSWLLLVGLYLGWAAQVILLQAPHEYVQVPLLLLALAICAIVLGPRIRTHRTARWVCVVFLAFVVARHPMLRWDRLSLWPRCVAGIHSVELKDRLAITSDSWGRTGHVDWQDLKRVEAYLCSQHVGNGELTCFHDCTFPLYLEMNLTPTTRYTFFLQAIGIYPSHREEIREALASSHQRFVVADLLATMQRSDWEGQVEGKVQSLPYGFPDDWREVFPWYEPVVFRAGRYQVHRVTQPVRRFWR